MRNLQEPRRRPPLSRRRIAHLARTLLALEADRAGSRGDRARQALSYGAEAELSVLFCGDAAIQALNRDYRGQDKPTDVLSFAQEDSSPAGPFLLGDIVLSTDTARRQARAGRRSLHSEIEWLLVHALLHLLGYDDETDSGAAEMEARGRAVIEYSVNYAPEAIHR